MGRLKELEVNTIDQLDLLVDYFNRISDRWEGPDGCGTKGTSLCSALVDNLNALKREPQALGITTIPMFPVAQVDLGG